MAVSYQRLAFLVKKNSDLAISVKKINAHLPTHYNTTKTKNIAEKFALLFLWQAQKNYKKIFKKRPLYKKKIWQLLYDKLHKLGKKGELTNISFFKKYFDDLKKDQKNISNFCPTTRSYILYNLWFSKQKFFDYFKKNYCFIQKNFIGEYEFKKMKPIFLWRRQFQKKKYFFHHGLISLNPTSFQKIIHDYIDGKKVYANLLEEKEFLRFCKANDNYLPNLAQGFFVDLIPILKKIAAQYFSHHTTLPNICWSGQFSCQKLASYSFLEDKIFISEIFDLPQKNLQILHYLIFHEMLHREIGIQRKGIKLYAHTKEFKKKEKEYPDFLQIQKELDNYLAMKGILY